MKVHYINPHRDVALQGPRAPSEFKGVLHLPIGATVYERYI